MTYDKQQAGEMTFITADQDMTMRQQLPICAQRYAEQASSRCSWAGVR